MALVIAPKGAGGVRPICSAGNSCQWVFAEHPLPGQGSFGAGAAILEFFDSLRRNRVRRLRVFLSGGASSLAWIPPAHLSEEDLLEQLRDLYRQPLSISELNAARSCLCALKGGGAARWLRKIAPQVQVRVDLISDVLPSGPEVVGSGPFWDGRVPHRVLADNDRWVQTVCAAVRRQAWPVLASRSGGVGPWHELHDWIKGIASDALLRRESGVVVLGCEPQVQLPVRAGRGGRQSHLAAALARTFAEALADGEVEFLCTSSDGVDGASGSAGAFAGKALGRSLVARPRMLSRLSDALERFDSATVLNELGALIPERLSGTNVQDLVVFRVRSSSPSSRRKTTLR